jgi:hypothetical protein
MKKDKDIYTVKQLNSKYIVTKNNEPFLLPKSDGQSIVTEFDSLDDANKYLTILQSLMKRSSKVYS